MLGEGFADGPWYRARILLSQVIRHDLIEFTLSDVAELKMLNLNAFSRVPHLIDLRFHLVEISFEALLTLLVCEVDLFQTSCQHFCLLLLRQVCLSEDLRLFGCASQILEVLIKFV